MLQEIFQEIWTVWNAGYEYHCYKLVVEVDTGGWVTDMKVIESTRTAKIVERDK